MKIKVETENGYLPKKYSKYYLRLYFPKVCPDIN